MYEAFKELKGEVENLTKLMVDNIGPDALKAQSVEDFIAMQSCLKMIDKSLNFMKAEVKKLDSIEEKLDEMFSYLKQKEEKEESI